MSPAVILWNPSSCLNAQLFPSCDFLSIFFLLTVSVQLSALSLYLPLPNRRCLSHHLFLRQSHFFHAAVIWYEHGLPHLSPNRTEGHPFFVLFLGISTTLNLNINWCPKLNIMFLENNSKNGKVMSQDCGKQQRNNALCSVCVCKSLRECSCV